MAESAEPAADEAVLDSATEPESGAGADLPTAGDASHGLEHDEAPAMRSSAPENDEAPTDGGLDDEPGP